MGSSSRTTFDESRCGLGALNAAIFDAPRTIFGSSTHLLITVAQCTGVPVSGSYLDEIPGAAIQEIRGLFAYRARRLILTMFRLRGKVDLHTVFINGQRLLVSCSRQTLINTPLIRFFCGWMLTTSKRRRGCCISLPVM